LTYPILPFDFVNPGRPGGLMNRAGSGILHRAISGVSA
jgi:hypothetical protein